MIVIPTMWASVTHRHQTVRPLPWRATQQPSAGGRGRILVRKADSRILRSVRQARSYARGEITDIEYVVNEAIEAASRYVSLLPAGQRVWGEREYDVADIAARKAISCVSDTDGYRECRL
jgi:hypothetical protein